MNVNSTGNANPTSLPWSASPAQTPDENWRYMRRVELVQVAGPLVMALLRDGEGALVSGDEWRGEDAAADRDRRVVERAVALAKMIQDAADRVRPRSR